MWQLCNAVAGPVHDMASYLQDGATGAQSEKSDTFVRCESTNSTFEIRRRSFRNSAAMKVGTVSPEYDSFAMFLYSSKATKLEK